MKYYAEKAGLKEGDKKNSWRIEGAFWRSWSFWSSERTGAANHMDDIIEDVLKEYREKYPENNDESSGLNTEA